MAHILPFHSRICLYATWPFIISGMVGLVFLRQWKPQRFRPAFSISLALCIALPGTLMTLFKPSEHPPFHSQPSQPVLRELKKQMQPGDILFVYHKARHALKFYGPREGITDYRVASLHDEIIPYLREIDGLRGNKRVWFFYIHWTSKQPFPDSIKYYMGNVIGRQIGYIPDPYNGNLEGDEDIKAAAYLYDLSNK